VTSDDVNHTVAAPGGCTYTTVSHGLWTYDSGTSFAAPVVAGGIALCKETGRCPASDAYQTRSIIMGDAAAFNNANPQFGFWGDPFHTQFANFGWLVCVCSW
jgi:subtilase family serine protease